MEVMQAKIIELTNDESQAHRKIYLNSIYFFALFYITKKL